MAGFHGMGGFLGGCIWIWLARYWVVGWVAGWLTGWMGGWVDGRAPPPGWLLHSMGGLGGMDFGSNGCLGGGYLAGWRG